MNKTFCDTRFRCAAEDRAIQQNRKIEYHDIGGRLMELRRIAWDKYHARALWSTPPHATYRTLRAVAETLRDNGDLGAAFLAAAIDKEISRRTGSAT